MKKDKPRFLIAEPTSFSSVAIDLLSEVADVECRAIGQEEISAALSMYDGIWIRLGLCIRKVDLPVDMRCRWLVTATTGTDHILPEAMAAGLAVLSLRGRLEFLDTIHATAEHTLALLLALARRIPWAHGAVLSGRWDRDAFRGVELKGRTAGIIGCGRLGRRVAEYLLALGMHVVGYDPYVNSTVGIDMIRDPLMLLRQCDVVTVHVALTESTCGLVGREWFAAMKPGALFINTSRGTMVDELSLLECLQSGRLAGAAVDVLSGEPAVGIGHPLIRYATQRDNLIITPHIGGAVEGVMARCEEHMADVVCRTIEAEWAGVRCS